MRRWNLKRSDFICVVLGILLLGLAGEPVHSQTTEPPRVHLLATGGTIAGGTSEIQREIIADQLLELPRAR